MGDKFKVKNFLLTHIPFIPCQSATPLQGYSFLKKLTWKIQGQDHNSRSHSGPNILLTHIPFVLGQIDPPTPEIQFFKIWPSKSKVKLPVKVTERSSRKFRQTNTAWCRYNAVGFLKNSHIRHSIACPLGRDMGCPLWIQSRIHIQSHSVQLCMWYLILDHVIMAPDCIFLVPNI